MGEVTGEQARADIRFVLADDAVAMLLVRVDVEHFHRGPENHLAAGIERSDIDHLGIGQLALDLLDAAFYEPLLLACRVILGVLFQVAVRPRLGNCRDDPGTGQGLQLD